MVDVDARAALTGRVFRKLAEPGFRSRLAAQAPDGSKPVIVALPEDEISSLLQEVHAAGGAANVAMPYLNGFVILVIEVADGPDDGDAPTLRSDCTAGVFLARVRLDAPNACYRFVAQVDQHTREPGHAEVVAVGD